MPTHHGGGGGGGGGSNSNAVPPSSSTLPFPAPATFTDGLPLPRILVFDLDYTLWPFWVDTHVTPPLKTKDGGAKSVDKFGESYSFYRDVPAILYAAKNLHHHHQPNPSPHHPIQIAAASRTHAPDLAITLLKQLTIPVPPNSSPSPSSSSTTTTTSSSSASSSTNNKSPKRAHDYFDHLQIFPGDKRTHFSKIQSKQAPGGSGGGRIAYEDMLFFDDEVRNRNVEALGVTMWLVRDGVTMAEIDNGVREWRRRNGREKKEDVPR